MPADRCPTCDREGCDGARLLAEHRRAMAGGNHDAANVTLTEWAALGCRPVDWRAKFFAAESDAAKDRDDARSWRNAIDRTKAPGDPVLRAIAELLSCTYLDAVPTPADDDIRRELAVAARIANDELRIKAGVASSLYSEKRDAAKWRRVEPLIDALREAAKVARHDYATEDDATVDHRVTGHELIDAVSELLAATKEPS